MLDSFTHDTRMPVEVRADFASTFLNTELDDLVIRPGVAIPRSGKTLSTLQHYPSYQRFFVSYIAAAQLGRVMSFRLLSLTLTGLTIEACL
jgi:hypothetical protein